MSDMIPEVWSRKILKKFYASNMLGKDLEWRKPRTRWERFRDRMREIARAPFFTYCPTCGHEHRRFG